VAVQKHKSNNSGISNSKIPKILEIKANLIGNISQFLLWPAKNQRKRLKARMKK
jgi:hypothetical protein